MKRIFAICCAFCIGWGNNSALAQALTTIECRQILQTYGTLPASCPKQSPGVMPHTQAMMTHDIESPTQDMRQNNIFFTRGGDTLTPESISQLRRLADVLNSPMLSHACIKLVGHSDSSGSELINMEIGTKRALVVRNQLAVLLDNPLRIESYESMGESKPLIGLPTNSHWQRRVEIWARKCPSIY